MARSGLLPEQMTYADEGCHVHPACLTCPLPECVFEDDVKRQVRMARARRRTAEAARLRSLGFGVDEVAMAMGMSTRSVYRYLRGARA